MTELCVHALLNLVANDLLDDPDSETLDHVPWNSIQAMPEEVIPPIANETESNMVQAKQTQASPIETNSVPTAQVQNTYVQVPAEALPVIAESTQDIPEQAGLEGTDFIQVDLTVDPVQIEAIQMQTAEVVHSEGIKWYM